MDFSIEGKYIFPLLYLLIFAGIYSSYPYICVHFRTDFYFETTDSNSPVGLPKGLAEHLVRNAYFKWKPLSKKEQPEEQTVLLESDVPQVVAEEVVVTSEEVDEQELIDSIDKIHIGKYSFEI